MTSTNYKYGLIFKIGELQKPALLLITNTCKFENCTANFSCTPRGATYECEGWATNKKKHCRMGDKTSLLVNKNLILSMMNNVNQLLAISHLPT